MSKYDYIIGVDIATEYSKDFSARSMKCMNCGSVIHTKVFRSEYSLIKDPKICPICRIEFKYGLYLS